MRYLLLEGEVDDYVYGDEYSKYYNREIKVLVIITNVDSFGVYYSY